jgi:branched-chain amino acid transport system ATP-binding protein
MTGPAAPAQATPSVPDDILLSLDKVSARYGAVAVLRDVSVSVPRSSAVAVLGPNGAGKTTMLRVASGLLRASGGVVTLGGVDVSRASTHVIAGRGLCHVPEGRATFSSLTVKENIVLSSPPRKEKESLQRVADLFPVLGSRLRQTVGSLSGGERQMLALGRALVRNPAVLAVDEASLGLSPIMVDKIYEALRRVRDEGVSVLLVEQYVNRALDFADYVYVLNRGTVVHAGPAADVDADTLISRYLGAGD